MRARWAMALASTSLLAAGCASLTAYGDPAVRARAEAARDAGREGAEGDAAGAGREESLVEGRGTVVELPPDQGFWGLRTDDGRRFRVSKLPPEFQKHGTRVRFQGRVRSEQATAGRWAEVLDLVAVSGI